MNDNFLKFTDVVRFSLMDMSLMKVKDDYESALKPFVAGQTGSAVYGKEGQTAPGLQVSIAASHAGMITRNNGFYLPDKMKKGVASFTADYPKPVLLHHKDHEDPIGRVIDATYVDTSGAILDKFKDLEIKNSAGDVVAVINDKFLKDFTSDRMPFGQQVDMVRSILRDSSLLEDQSYDGLGYALILTNITNSDAIAKLLDGRYITGSVGATTDKAICSVCKADWTESGPCDHKPGGIYDDVKCFIIAGNLIYDEYSFVNVPADRHSRVLTLNYNGIQNSIEVVDDYNGRIYEVQLRFPQYDSENKEDNRMADKNGKAGIKDSVPAPEAKGNADGKQATSVADATPETKKVDGEAETKKVQDDKKDKKESIEDFVVRLVDSEEGISDDDELKLYDALWAEVEAGFKDGEFTLEQLGVKELGDAKLSTEKRKSLPKSTFCGPNRSFPVPDCAHVTAARRLIGRFKGEGSKSAILACVSRKAKALGCSTAKDAVTTAGNIKEDMNHSRMLRMVLSVLDEDVFFSNESVLGDDEKKMLQTIIKRMASLVGKDSYVAALHSEELAQDETALVDEVAKNEEIIGDLRDRLEATQKEYTLLYQDMENLQDSLVKEKTKTRQVQESYATTLKALSDTKVEETDWTSLTDDAIVVEVTRLIEVVDMIKITDKLGDGMSRTPKGDVNNPTEVQDDTEKKKSKVTVANLKKIEERYWELRIGTSEAAAEDFLSLCKRDGFLPRESETTIGGSN